MPTTTFRVLRREAAAPYGIVRFATTTNVTTNNLVISTALAERYPNADFFNGEWWAVLETDSDGGTAANDGMRPRRVTDYASGQLTLSGAALLAEDEANDWVLIRGVYPEDIKRAYNMAREAVFPHVGIMRDVETLVSGLQSRRLVVPSTVREIRRIYLGGIHGAQHSALNQFTNGGVEDWGSATSLESFTAAGTGVSVNQEAITSPKPNYMVLTGQYSAHLILPGSDTATLLQTAIPDAATEGVELNVAAWVYTNIASRVSMRIASSDGTAHGGTGWEKIKHNAILGATVQSFSAGIAVSSGAATSAFVDELLANLGPTEGLEGPWSLLNSWDFIPPIEGGANGGLIRTSEPLPPLMLVRFEGLDVLKVVSETEFGAASDAIAIEVDNQTKGPLLAKMWEILSEEGYRPQWAEERAIPTQNVITHYRNMYERALDEGKGTPAPSGQPNFPV
jgi:hypothetical protein